MTLSKYNMRFKNKNIITVTLSSFRIRTLSSRPTLPRSFRLDIRRPTSATRADAGAVVPPCDCVSPSQRRARTDSQSSPDPDCWLRLTLGRLKNIKWYVCMYTCIHRCIHVQAVTQLCMYVCIHVHTFIRTYVCIKYVCMLYKYECMLAGLHACIHTRACIRPYVRMCSGVSTHSGAHRQYLLWGPCLACHKS